MAKKATANLQHLEPKVQGVKVKKSGLHIVYRDRVLDTTAEQAKEIENEVAALFRHEPHQDLADLVNKLTPHLAFLCDQEEQNGFESFTDEQVRAILSRYKLRGVSFKYKSDSDRGVQLNGYRVLNSKKVMNFLAPTVKFNSGGEGYEFADHVEELAENLERELILYIGGKRAEPGQSTRGFGELVEADGEEGNGDEDNA